MSLSKRGIALEINLVEAYKTHENPDRLLREFDEALLEHSVFMRTRARSYRQPVPLKVGAAGVGFMSSGRPALLEGANNSPFRGAPRDCAEMDITKWVDRRGCERLGRLYVAANGDPNTFREINGLPAPALDMCSDCRELFQDHSVISEDLRVITFNTKTGARVDQSFGDVLVRYAGVEPPLPSRLLLAPVAQATAL